MNIKTHNGIFHADDVLACGIVASLCKDAVFTRKRAISDDEQAAVGFDYVIDTGGRYDGVKFFDHHQSDFERRHANGVPMSAFGLIWEKLGRELIRVELLNQNPDKDWSTRHINQIFTAVLPFVQCQDAHDNGKLKLSPAKFADNPTVTFDLLTFQNVISLMNPQVGGEVQLCGEAAMMEAFQHAVKLGQRVLAQYILSKAGKIASWEYVGSMDQGRSVLELGHFVAWGEAVGERPHITYVIHPGLTDGSWVISAAKHGGGYATTENLRKPFPKEWAGLQGSTLAKVTNIEGSTFCHKGRHLVTTTSLESARKIAEQALMRHT